MYFNWKLTNNFLERVIYAHCLQFISSYFLKPTVFICWPQHYHNVLPILCPMIDSSVLLDLRAANDS